METAEQTEASQIPFFKIQFTVVTNRLRTMADVCEASVSSVYSVDS
jgi:hypothetical protein